MFALIKWVEDGKFSILPTEHIRDFDEDEYFTGMEEKNVYLVEWRQGVKEPKGGWPVYEASIIKIAEREKTLQIKLKEIEEQLPKPDIIKRKSKPSIKLLEAAELRDEPAAKKKVYPTDLPNDLKVWNEKKIEHLQRVINLLREENMNLKKENKWLKNEILEKIPPLLQATEHLLTEPMKSNADVPDMSKSQPHAPLSHPPKPVDSNAAVLDVPKAPSKASLSGAAKGSSDAEYVELAHGTGIKILKHQWASALQAQTATSMVRVLLMATFPLEVLIHSNLKGGQSKTDIGAERRTALDKETMAAIYVAVRKRFPNVSRGALGIAVNSKLGN
ncbi:uncharacterized protein LOC131539513 isoform X2 [Onychostoma macrolepis]|uniref:BEN domain-containing protein n=1 Tax=Onychostoma macrolepis TaxID=369639 RepID=A0A7J6D499_9TELE|nr:uncharacterized protein LOC131539513 isoform X2 [Onychostoma macrolepis]KAF4114053.1 hypothetical protein G5714_004276 [Onychostoma macrolepis]